MKRHPIQRVALKDLKDAPYNPRKIGSEELKGLSASMERFGVLEPVVWNKRTKNVVGGHQRLKVLRQKGIKEIDVVVVDVSLEEERAMNVALNNPSIQGTWSVEIEALLRQIKEDLGEDVYKGLRMDDLSKHVDQQIASLGDEAERAMESLKAEESDNEDDPGKGEEVVHGDAFGAVQFADAVEFASTNKWGIPDLLPEKLCKTFPTGVHGSPQDDPAGKLVLQGSLRWPEDCEKSYLGFFVDDWRFDSVWTSPAAFAEKLAYHPFKGIVTPDFSVNVSQPMALALYNIFRSRWCGRYWQDAGHDIIPGMQWTAPKAIWSMAGLPEKVPVIAMQVRTDHSATAVDLFVQRMLQYRERLHYETLVVYGTSLRDRIQKKIPKGIRVVWLTSFMELRNVQRREETKGKVHQAV